MEKEAADRASVNETKGKLAAPPHRRFLTGRRQDYLRYIQAARDYVSKVGGADVWMFLKPYSRDSLLEFSNLMYDVMNLLGVMRVPPKGRILEVGSGAGWLTEILAGLGYEIYALEPSAEMIDAVRQRLAGFIQHHRYRNPPPVHFLCEPLEECSLSDGSVEGVIFHEALHHVVDEERGFAQCSRVLAPGGVLGVTGESEWRPGKHNLEAACEEEMARYGTLENPYTFEYLKYLLSKHGFEEVTRYHGVNGFFPERLGGLSIAEAAQAPAHDRNHITALKPWGRPTTANQCGATQGIIRVLDVKRDSATGVVRIQVELTNCGETLWLSEPRTAGWVVLSSARGTAGHDFLEAAARNRLPKPLPPGESLRMEAVYSPPAGGWTGDWRLDLVNEGVAWFNRAVPVRIPA